MGLIHIELFATLDLVGQSPGGPGEDPVGFPFGGWQAPLMDEVAGAQVGAAYEGTDALLLGRRTQLRNIDRDPRVVLSFVAPRVPGAFLNPYAVLHARATIQPSDDAWNLLDRLTKVYMSPDTGFPAPKGPGYIVRYSVERIGGVGQLGL